MIPYLRNALIVLLGYGLAVFSTPFFLLMAFAAWEIVTGGTLPDQQEVFDFLMAGWLLTAISAAVPFLVAIGLMARFRRYDWPTHSVAGAIVAYVALSILTGHPMTPSVALVPYVFGGAGAGIIYWLCRRRFGWQKT